MKTNKRKCIFIAGIAFAVSTTVIAEPPKAFLSVHDILSCWQKNYGALKSMKVSYCEKIISAEPPSADPNIIKTLLPWNHVERIEEGDSFRVRYSAAKEGFAKNDSVVEMSFDGVSQKVYFAAEKEGRVYAGLAKRGIGTTNVLKRYLLLHPYRTSATLKGEGPTFSKLVSMGISDPNFSVVVRSDLEQTSGQMCHVLELVSSMQSKDKVAIIWVAHEKGMLPLKFQELSNGAIVQETAIEQTDFAKTEAGGLWFPKKAFTVSNLPNSLGIVRWELSVSEFVPHVKTDQSMFRFDFPNGTHVLDRALGLDYIVGVEPY
jgi:hypothetical protein